MKLKIYLAARGHGISFQPPTAAAAVERAVAVMMVRDEADIILQNLTHRYSLGFRKFAVLVNACADPTPTLLRALQATHSDAIAVSIVDPVEGYYQTDKTQSAVEFASAYFEAIRNPVKWCFILDADEFIAVGEALGLEGLLTVAEREVIAFHLCNATNMADSDYMGNRNVYRHSDVVVGCAAPVVPKNAFLVARWPSIVRGNHPLRHSGFSLDCVLIAAEHGARLVHLPYRSLS